MKQYMALIYVTSAVFVAPIVCPEEALAYCKSAKAVCHLVHNCVEGHNNNDSNNIRNGAANIDSDAGGHQVWTGLSSCAANGGGANDFADYAGGCANPDYWTIAKAELPNLDAAFCDRYAN
jgi:hypothetical protein